jgi:hypothetical protein
MKPKSNNIHCYIDLCLCYHLHTGIVERFFLIHLIEATELIIFGKAKKHEKS